MVGFVFYDIGIDYFCQWVLCQVVDCIESCQGQFFNYYLYGEIGEILMVIMQCIIYQGGQWLGYWIGDVEFLYQFFVGFYMVCFVYDLG